MKKQPEITVATRRAFVEAFCALYQVKPIETIIIRELTSKAGYNRSMFYQYFEDVFALLTYLEDSVISHVKKHIVANIEEAISSSTSSRPSRRCSKAKKPISKCSWIIPTARGLHIA